MSQPLLSVLLLTYNHEKYISDCIESILMQKTNFDLEVLIGEDCSTDNTRVIINKYIQKYPEKLKLVTSDKNIGALKNENKLMNLAQGKYIAFIEGDDFWMDSLKLQKQVDFLESNPDFGLVHGDVNHYYENIGKTEYAVNKSKQAIIPQSNVFEYFLKPEPLFIKTATTCFRKELVTRHFDYALAIEENWPLTDLPLWMDISYYSKVHYFNEVFATYRLLNESASRTRSIHKHYKYIKDLFKIKVVYMEKYKTDFSVVDALSENYYRTLLRYSFKLKDNKAFDEAAVYLRSKNHKFSMKENLLIAARGLKLNYLLAFFY